MFLVPVTMFFVVFRHRVNVSWISAVAAEKIPKSFLVCGHHAIGAKVLAIYLFLPNKLPMLFPVLLDVLSIQNPFRFGGVLSERVCFTCSCLGD